MLSARAVDHKKEETILDGTRRDVQRGHFILPSVPISGQRPKLTLIIILPKNTGHSKPKRSTIVNNVAKKLFQFLFITSTNN